MALPNPLANMSLSSIERPGMKLWAYSISPPYETVMTSVKNTPLFFNPKYEDCTKNPLTIKKERTANTPKCANLSALTKFQKSTSGIDSPGVSVAKAMNTAHKSVKR